MTKHNNPLIFVTPELRLGRPTIPRKSRDTFYLLDDFVVQYAGWVVHVKEGFETDGASIPRVAYRVIGHPFEEYLAAAVPHDALYQTELMSREWADNCFDAAMNEISIKAKLVVEKGESPAVIGYLRRNAMYWAVRSLGFLTWGRHTPESIASARRYVDVYRPGDRQ